jgi:hypothetical protein
MVGFGPYSQILKGKCKLKPERKKLACSSQAFKLKKKVYNVYTNSLLLEVNWLGRMSFHGNYVT